MASVPCQNYRSKEAAVPAEWIGRIVAGKHGAAMMTEIRGASNQKAKSLLPWTLRWPSWRKGFRDGLGEPIREINKARRLSKPDS